LDTDAIREALKGPMGQLDAFAVAGHYAVRNPSHERQAQQLISDITGATVTASCDLSDSLNGPRRALTAAFNAKIVSLIVQLENAVRASMTQLGLNLLAYSASTNLFCIVKLWLRRKTEVVCGV